MKIFAVVVTRNANGNPKRRILESKQARMMKCSKIEKEGAVLDLVVLGFDIV